MQEKERRKDHSTMGNQTDPRRVVIYAQSRSTCVKDEIRSQNERIRTH